MTKISQFYELNSFSHNIFITSHDNLDNYATLQMSKIKVTKNVFIKVVSVHKIEKKRGAFQRQRSPDPITIYYLYYYD